MSIETRGSAGAATAARSRKRSRKALPSVGRELEASRPGVPAVAEEEVAAPLQGRPEIERAVAPARCPDHVAELRPDHRRVDPRPRPAGRPRDRRSRRSTVRGRCWRTRPARRPPWLSPRRRPCGSGRAGRRWPSSSASACRLASAGSSASRSRAASSASPIRPAAFRRGARANEIVSRSTADGSIRARSSRAATPGRGFLRSRSRPSRAIARFSPTIGATSATVPIVARSARSRAACGPPGSVGQEQLGDLEGDPAARQARVRILRVGPMRVDHGVRRRHDLRNAMVVGDDHVDAATPSRSRSRRGSSCRSPP